MKLLKKFIVCVLGINVAIFGSYVLAATGNYQVKFNPPSDMQWHLINNEQDSGGYMKKYSPQGTEDDSSQSIIINYGVGITTSLRDSMQEALGLMSQADCEIKSSKIITQQKNTLIFTTLLDDCSNGKSLKQVFKVFNMPEGQYSIIYAADSSVVSSKAIHKMDAVIESAKVVHLR